MNKPARSDLGTAASAGHELGTLRLKEATRTAEDDALTQLRNRLLLPDLSRASTGELRLECRSVDVGELLAEAVRAFRPMLLARRQIFEVSVPAGPLPMRGDAVRLTQVISNLLDNAARYTPLGGEVGLSLAVCGQWLVLTVSDNGIGIAPESLARVFKPFVRDRQAVGHDSAGLGIGLTVVHEFVVAHGGHVSAFSAGPGCGSRFTVMLPAGAA